MIAALPLLLAVGIPLSAALITLQTVINGAEHPAMIDVGETQIVLNVWGTLHATGYPLYVIVASALTGLLRTIGLDAITAPALTSWLTGAAALALLYGLFARLLGHRWAAAAIVAAYGLTRMIWLHHSIAEIYAFTLLITVGLYALALQPGLTGTRRLALLALLGGIGVAHHRAIAMLIPALLIAAWPDLRALLKRRDRGLVPLIGLLALGLIGFAAYIYLPLREQAGAGWVYGEPGTLPGLWDQFIGREADRFIGGVRDLPGLLANIQLVITTLINDFGGPPLGAWVIVGGLLGLVVGLRDPSTRRAALVFTVGGMTAFLFHAAAYTDVLAALIVIVTLSLAFGWGRLLIVPLRRSWRRVVVTAFTYTAVTTGLFISNGAFIAGLTRDPAAADAIAVAADAPPGSTLMIAWGTRHFAVGFARDVQGQFPDVALVDHKADFRQVLAAGDTLVTPYYTFYAQPIGWWRDRLGAEPVLTAAAPGLIRVAVERVTAPDAPDQPSAVRTVLTCDPDRLVLRVDWSAAAVPDRDQAVFVHLVDAAGTLLAQADQSAPVSGLRPLTGWQPNEVIADAYALPRLANAAAIRFGLYYQETSGAFVNTTTDTLPVHCA